MTTAMKKTSHSYNQNKLKIICDKLCDRIDDLINILNLSELKHNGKMLVGPCPVHQGDNASAFNLYPEGEYYRGNWKCRTHNCDKIFKGSIIGFIRGVLSNQKYGWSKDGDQAVSFDDTIEFIESFLGSEIDKIKISRTQLEKNKFANIIKNIVQLKENKQDNKITRNIIRKSLIMPCDYFLQRNFQEDILNRYDVGLCDKADKEMYNRAVVPIYDHDHKYMVGCTGRSIFNKCDICSCYHDSKEMCPKEIDAWKYCKWRHSKDFKSQNYLYNFWFAKKYIQESNKVILVESPGNVWRLEESGIHNAVAMFGSSLSDRQKIILDGSGAMTIITIMDNDEAGKNAAKSISLKCKNTYNIINIDINEKNDVADMTTEEINTLIKPYI